MNTQMLSDITSRLVEVVCESGEEMQGFVTEILQTIEKSVATLDIGVIGKCRDQCKAWACGKCISTMNGSIFIIIYCRHREW